MKKYKHLKDSQVIIMCICNMYLTVWLMEELQGAWIYSQQVKNTANKLLKLMEKRINTFFDYNLGVDTKTNDNAIIQLEDVTDMIKKIYLCCINLEEKHVVGFQNEFKMLLLKYHLYEKLVDEIFEL